MTLTASHLTVDTESGQCIFLRHSLFKLRLTEVPIAFVHVFQNKSQVELRLLFL